MEKTFRELWANEQTREQMKRLVVARLEKLPDNLMLCIGGEHELA